MIRVFIHKHGSSEVTSGADAYAALSQAPESALYAVLRMQTDDEWLNFAVILAEKLQRAMHGSALVSAPVFVWTQGNVFPDGDGWRIVCAKQQLQAQMQGPTMGPNGPLNLRHGR